MTFPNQSLTTRREKKTKKTNKKQDQTSTSTKIHIFSTLAFKRHSLHRTAKCIKSRKKVPLPTRYNWRKHTDCTSCLHTLKHSFKTTTSSDYYCCQSLLEFQSWWRRRDTKKFVQIDEVYTSKEPVAFVLDFEHSLDEKPNPSPIPEIIKQFSDAVHDLAQEEYNMTVQSQWIWNDNSRWTTEKGSQKYKLSLHLINSHLIFTNIRHLEAFMVQLIEKKLPQYPPPIVDLSIYRRSSGQFRLPFCQKAGCPNKNFVCTDAPFHEYFIVKPNADPLSL